MAPEPISPSEFTPLLERLEGSSVSYRLLRPSGAGAIQGPELDLLVWPAHRHEFQRLAAAEGYRPLRQRSQGKTVYGRLADDHILYLDVHYAFVQQGLCYHRLEAVADRVARTADGFKTLTPEDLLLHLYFHNLIGKKGVQEKDLSRIQALVAGDLDRHYLSRQFTDPAQRRLFDDVCAQPESFAPGTRAAQQATQAVRSGLKPLGTWPAWLRRIGMRLRPTRRRGINVAILGVDGCGKSTTTQKTRELLDAGQLRSEQVYMGPWGQVRSAPLRAALRLGLFPPKDVSSHSVKKLVAGRVKGTVYYGAVFLELWQRFLTQVYPALRRGSIVLSDRYVYDLRFIYKKRRMDAFPWLRQAVCACFPQPDLIVLLHNDAETIASRKAQLSPAQIDEFQELYRRAIAPYTVLEVKTDRAPDEVAATIVRKAMRIYFERNVER